MTHSQQPEANFTSLQADLDHLKQSPASIEVFKEVVALHDRLIGQFNKSSTMTEVDLGIALETAINDLANRVVNVLQSDVRAHSTGMKGKGGRTESFRQSRDQRWAGDLGRKGQIAA